MKFYSLSGDGVVGSGDWKDWDNAHGTTTGLYVNDTQATHWSDISIDESLDWNFMRVFFPFDTSALPDDAVISSSTFYSYRGGGATTSVPNFDFYTLVQTTNSSTTNLAEEDYSLCGSVDDPIIGGTSEWKSDSAFYQLIKLNEIGRSWISTTSYTMLGLRSGMDAMDNPGATSTILGDALGNYTYYSETTADKRPYLEVWYSSETVADPCTPTPGQPFFQTQDCYITTDVYHNDKWITNGYKLISDGGKLIID